MAQRHPEEIRRSIETTREDLRYSVTDLQGKINEITDWRSKLRRNRQQALVGAAIAGSVRAGGPAATVGLTRR